MIPPGEKTFAGWSANGQTYAAGAGYTVTANVTFTAQWADSTYTVTYSPGEGGGTVPASQSVASGTSITLPDQGSMTAPGTQIFAGWSADGQTYAAGASYTVTADATFTAHWVSPDAPTYTVTYELGDGTGTAPAAQPGVASGVSITLPVQGDMTAPPGKTFAGWSVDGQAYAAGASYAVTANVTFTAQWFGVASISAEYDGQADYGIGEPFDLSRLVVTAQFDNGTSGVIDVAEANLTGWDNTAAGTKNITVTVGSHTTSQTINVTVKTLAERIAAALGATGTATITLYADESLEPTTLTASSSTTITLQGSEVERTIQIGSGNGPLFTLGARVTLVLDSNITLQGKAGNTGDGLVYVSISTAALTMKAGSRITGNTTTGTTGGVFLYLGSFTMEGGTITGNTTTATRGIVGGVYVNLGSFAMTGGTITGNTSAGTSSDTGGLYILGSGNYTTTISGGEITGNTGARFGDVAVASSRTLTLSGAPLIGSITLAATSSASPKISVSSALTGSPYPVDLAATSASSVEATKSLWAALTLAQRTIITGSTNPEYTPTGADIGKFTLRNFVSTAAETQAITQAYSIGTDGVLTLGSGSVSGTVALGNGSGALTNVSVALKKDGVQVGSDVLVNAEGAYSFASVDIAGGYTVEASLAGYVSAVSASFAVTGAVPVPALTLFLPTATLHDDANPVAGNYTVLAALRWIAANAAADGNYTITLTDDDALEPYTLNAAALNNQTGVTITLKGDTQERILQIGAGNGRLFLLNARVTLALDEYITLQGKNNNTDSVVYVSTYSTLKMKDGSKITGNTTSGSAGGVYVNSGSFIMEGGSITGNTSAATGGNTSGGGGVVVASTSSTALTISGGTISGNIGCYGNVLVRTAGTLNLSGNPTIENITLMGSTSTPGKVVVTGALSGSAINVDLAWPNGAGLAAAKTEWAALTSPQIIAGSTNPAYSLTSSDIAKFSLSDFVGSDNTELISTTYSSAAIDNTGVLVLGAATP